MPFTHKEFFEFEISQGTTPENPAYYNLHSATSDLVAEFHPSKVLEIGPGMGVIIECLNKKGIEAEGIDSNPFHQEYFNKRNPHLISKYHLLDKDLKIDMYDFIVCIEVFEHLTDSVIKKYLSRFHAETVLFSSTPHASTPEFDEKWGHINIKTEAQWLRIFQEYGYDIHSKPHLPTEWTLILKKKKSKSLIKRILTGIH
jgi:2-polyprenyl-3-methyl-5-hydroxy-6-metoxy-1,4-benzoquinol methylase